MQQVIVTYRYSVRNFSKLFYFLSHTASAQPQQQPILDLFGSDVDGGAHSTQSATSHRASDDLLQLAANPFASPTGAPVIPALPTQAGSWATGPSQNGFGGGGQFASDNSFANAFGASANGSSNGESFCYITNKKRPPSKKNSPSLALVFSLVYFLLISCPCVVALLSKAADDAMANPFGLPQSSPAHHPPPPRPPPPSAATNMGDLLYGIESVVAPASSSSGSSPLPVRAVEMGTFDFLSMDSSSTTNSNATSAATAAATDGSASPAKQAAKGAVSSLQF